LTAARVCSRRYRRRPAFGSPAITLAILCVIASLGAGARSAAGETIVERGHYLVTAADCAGCHTANPNQPFAGGVVIATPLGTIVTPNITRDAATGIGAWSDAEFYRALHEGVGRTGENLYPAMPYVSFTRLRRDDVLAIKAYLWSLPPIRRPNLPHHLQIPFQERWLISLWKLLNFREGEFRPDAAQTDSWNRGAYLVEALAACGECHTPRSLTLGSKSNEGLAGGVVEGWQAYNITPDPVGGIGDWSDAEIAAYLASGVAPRKAMAAGPMAGVVERSTSLLPAQDLADMVTYLRTLPALRSRTDAKSRFSWGVRKDEVIDIRGVENLDHPTGRTLYFGNCAGCHGADGGGTRDEAYPALVGNTIVGATRADNLILCVLGGVRRTVAGKLVEMPAFASDLNDGEIAALANYVLVKYGDTIAFPVTPERVGALRAGATPTPPIVWLLWGTVGGATLMLMGALAVWVRRTARWT
jgi:mono/diheme cytochrome c family protein